MVDTTTWKDMKQHAFKALTSEGPMNVQELEKIVDIGCAEGGFDSQDKAVLINVIANLTRADLNAEMWAKVDELIQKFELGHDDDASIEHLEDEQVEHQ